MTEKKVKEKKAEEKVDQPKKKITAFYRGKVAK